MNASTTAKLRQKRIIPRTVFPRATDATRGLRTIRFTLAVFCALLLGAASLRAAEVIPPAPRDHFNDYAGVVRGDTARQLEAELTQFERDTSNQILVAIYSHMQSDSSIEDYTFRVKEAWSVGLKGRNNGAVLFIFSQDRKIFVQVGYGLEGALPDALCKQIIENEITPRFRNGDFDGGVSAGTRALLAAARGEYTGSGQTVRDRNRGAMGGGNHLIFFIIAAIVLSSLSRLFRRNTIYSSRGRISPWIIGGGGGGWSGGGGGGGGSGGGGGAGGSW